VQEYQDVTYSVSFILLSVVVLEALKTKASIHIST